MALVVAREALAPPDLTTRRTAMAAHGAYFEILPVR